MTSINAVAISLCRSPGIGKKEFEKTSYHRARRLSHAVPSVVSIQPTRHTVNWSLAIMCQFIAQHKHKTQQLNGPA